MIDRVKYELAKASGTLELLRGDEIARHVRKKYTFGAELRLDFNLRKDPTNPEYIAKFEEHEEYVEECKAIVDREFSELERMLQDEIQNT